MPSTKHRCTKRTLRMQRQARSMLKAGRTAHQAVLTARMLPRPEAMGAASRMAVAIMAAVIMAEVIMAAATNIPSAAF